MSHKLYLLPIAVILFSTVAAGVGEAKYKGNLQIDLQDSELSPGEEQSIDIKVSNNDDRPIVDGYVVLHLVRGEEPYYPSQKSDKDNVILEKKVEDINLRSGETRNIQETIEIPSEPASGSYRVDAYFKTTRTPVSGLPFIFSSPKYESFEVSGGEEGSIKVLRTETVLQGVNETAGDWDPETRNFNNTRWPELTGPVGVLVTEDMETVDGEIVVENTGETEDGQVHVTICEWDDTACDNEVDSVNRETEFQTGEETWVPVELSAPEDPGAYAVRIEARVDGEMRSLYRNRIIKEGKTARIRKMTVDKPYHAGGEQLSVGVLAGTSPDHYTDPVMEGLSASVAVKDLDTDETIMQKEKDIVRLSETTIFEQLYFNTTLEDEVSRYEVSASISNDGEIYDTHSYIVDSSKFSTDIKNIELEDYRFNNSELSARLCAETESGAPASGEVQSMLMENSTLKQSQGLELGGCTDATYSAEEGSYKLLVNADEQYSFNISESQEQKEATGEGPGTVAIVAVALAITAGVIYYLRG